jgi:hypothetical protein
MGDDGCNEDDSPDDPPRRPSLQFSLRGLLLLTAAVALLFGMLRWADVPPEASVMILVSLIIAGVAAIGLMVAIMKE